VSLPFTKDGALKKAIKSAQRFIELPEQFLIEDTRWMEFAAFPVFWQGPYNSLPSPLESVKDRKTLTCDAIPGIEFPLIKGGRLALASRRLGQPIVNIALDQNLKKLYLLVLPFVENHDVFTECAQVRVTCELRADEPPMDRSEEPIQWTKSRYTRVVFERVLTTPGDLDSFFPEYHVGPFATSRLERPDRYGLLAPLRPDQEDWREGIPLAGPYGMLAMFSAPPRNSWPEGEFRSFPQPQFWASCPVIRTDSATFNVVEIDLGRPRRVLGIELESPLQDAAIGLVSVVGLTVDQEY